MKASKKGFTLIEIMIVVAIIGILAAIAIPNFVRYRKTAQMNACIGNLKQIQSAIEQCKMAGTVVPAEGDIFGSDKYIKASPKCPTLGSYSYSLNIEDTKNVPSCSNTDTEYPHKLPDDV